jgi:hypothetical protein
MTIDEVCKIPAGPQLDAVYYEQVYGWRIVNPWPNGPWGGSRPFREAVEPFPTVSRSAQMLSHEIDRWRSSRSDDDGNRSCLGYFYPKYVSCTLWDGPRVVRDILGATLAEAFARARIVMAMRLAERKEKALAAIEDGSL